jgi:hypothetical protein
MPKSCAGRKCRGPIERALRREPLHADSYFLGYYYCVLLLLLLLLLHRPLLGVRPLILATGPQGQAQPPAQQVSARGPPDS